MKHLRPNVARLLAGLVALAAPACIAMANPAKTIPTQNSEALPEYIGICWMEPDGTIKMRLRVEGPGGIVGHSLLEYAPTHPDYGSIMKHVGPLKPGEIKSVRPWPN